MRRAAKKSEIFVVLSAIGGVILAILNGGLPQAAVEIYKVYREDQRTALPPPEGAHVERASRDLPANSRSPSDSPPASSPATDTPDAAEHAGANQNPPISSASAAGNALNEADAHEQPNVDTRNASVDASPAPNRASTSDQPSAPTPDKGKPGESASLERNDAPGQQRPAPKPIVVTGNDAFSLCGYDGFHAVAAINSGIVTLSSTNRNVPNREFRGWEKDVSVGSETVLFEGCEVRVTVRENLQDRIILIEQLKEGADRT